MRRLRLFAALFHQIRKHEPQAYFKLLSHLNPIIPPTLLGTYTITTTIPRNTLLQYEFFV